MNQLLNEIEKTSSPGVSLWWLGHCGFAVKAFDMVFYLDPFLSGAHSPLRPEEVTNADLILCTHSGPTHMDPASIPAMLAASPRAKVLLPKSAAAHAHSLGVPYERMTTTDSDLRVEFFKHGTYGRVYSVPSAHPELDWTPLRGYPYLGYLVRFGGVTIYHAGDCRSYEGIAGRLRPYNVTVALLPINGAPNFDAAQAAQLAEDIGARWVIPMHFEPSPPEDAKQSDPASRFIDHMLGFRPALGFKVFQAGEGWEIPE